jgi:long-chain acyl-CoA synthetase
MNIAQLLLRSATVYPERPAILHGERVLFDYRTFAGRAASIAASMRRTLGLAEGDRVAVF